MNIIVCIPGRSVTLPFLSAWTQFLCTTQHRVMLTVWHDPNIHFVREYLFTVALESKAERIVLIDSDILFTPEALEKLITDPAPVISGVYRMPFVTNEGYGEIAAFEKLDIEEFKATGRFVPMTERQAKGRMDVAAVGLGFFAMNREVALKIERPAFGQRFITNDVDKIFMGEDLSFCSLLHKYEIPIVLDGNIRVNHEKMMLI